MSNAKVRYRRRRRAELAWYRKGGTQAFLNVLYEGTDFMDLSDIVTRQGPAFVTYDRQHDPDTFKFSGVRDPSDDTLDAFRYAMQHGTETDYAAGGNTFVLRGSRFPIPDIPKFGRCPWVKWEEDNNGK